MATLLKRAPLFFILAFVLLLFLGLNDHVPRHYMVIAFGLVFMSFALEVLVSRRDLIGRVRDRVGSGRWKIGLLLFWTVGSVTVAVGAHPLVAILPDVARAVIVACAGLAVAGVAWAIVRVQHGPQSAAPTAEVLDTASTYAAYGRTAQAIALLEEALARSPGQPDILKKLHELRK